MSSSTDAQTPESKLETLKASALKAYSQKDYAKSTELYASACEIQSTLYGENNPQNAHLLYLYGRSLFEVAVKKSDVLGGVKEDSSAGASTKEVKKETTKKETTKGIKPLPTVQKGGLFQFTGDENWDDTDEEDEDEDGDENDEKEKADDDDDDFTLAWEILDYARVLFEKQLSPETETEADTKAEENGAAEITTETSIKLTKEETHSTKVMLADTYDILGEVSLESESFAQAAKDLASALDLKLTLYPQESTLIPEAHFKLSLALEFTAAAEDVSPSDRAKGREAAAEQMEKAIASCRARIAKEEAELGADDSGKGKGKEVVTKSLKDAREMVEELETRLVDLRTPDVVPGQEKLEGLLGQLIGEDQAGAKKRIEEAMSKANDLTGLVRKKVKVEEPALAVVPKKEETEKVDIVVGESKGGKRKLDDLSEEAAPEAQTEKSEGENKKTKVEAEAEEK